MPFLFLSCKNTSLSETFLNIFLILGDHIPSIQSFYFWWRYHAAYVRTRLVGNATLISVFKRQQAIMLTQQWYWSQIWVKLEKLLLYEKQWYEKRRLFSIFTHFWSILRYMTWVKGKFFQSLHLSDWSLGPRLHGQHMAVRILRFYGCTWSFLRHEPHSWCSQRVSLMLNPTLKVWVNFTQNSSFINVPNSKLVF